MNKERIGEKLGEYVRTRRLAREVDIPAIAETAGVDASYWRKLEAGKYRTPSPRFLQLIARALDCPLEDLYTLSGYTTLETLPSLSPYLRTRYPGLPPEAVSDLEKFFELQRAYYDIPDDQPVYPPLPKDDSAPRRQPKRRDDGRNGADHPWRST